jgi:hypothetical protein
VSGGFIAVMVEPRGGLLEGEHATVLNKAVWRTREGAEARAATQARFEERLGNPAARFAVLELPEAPS